MLSDSMWNFFVTRKNEALYINRLRPIGLVILFLCHGSSVYAIGDMRALKARKKPQMSPPQVRTKMRVPTSRQKLQYLDIDRVKVDTDASESEDVSEFISALKVSSTQWKSISNPRTKHLVVSHFISRYRKDGIVIEKPASHYVAMIDSMADQRPDFLSNPFDELLETMAIVEYDFNNGQDKDMMARKVLGEEGYIRNKERLGIQ